MKLRKKHMINKENGGIDDKNGINRRINKIDNNIHRINKINKIIIIIIIFALS